ncbi:ABC transporter permease [Aestuariivirga sp.]|uniref:ABC transporter permease n=1 Tax=Aestuariivirga sp. TaxID=2650926 RepID=UPI0025B9AA13|nr:ABC transporter permease [Aestuariivirga sp.]
MASRSRNVWRALMAEPLGVMGGVIVLSFVVMALFAPWIAPYDPLKIDVMHKFSGPSLAHWAGTDQLGRDLLSRIIYGARTALGVAMTATGVAGLAGILLGLIAGYGPRWLDSLLILCFDSMTSLPMIMFALAVITVLGPSTGTLILVIILVSIPGYARFIRAQTLSLVRSDFILAEKAMNASHWRVILLHLLPNVVGQLLVVLSMDIPVVIMLEAGLSYLSLGVKPPTPSWGNILYDGYVSLRQSPGMVIVAGIPLILATLGFTFLGEALRDALDPRLQLRTLT